MKATLEDICDKIGEESWKNGIDISAGKNSFILLARHARLVAQLEKLFDNYDNVEIQYSNPIPYNA